MNRLLVFKLIFTVVTVTLLLFQIVIWKKISPAIARTRFPRIFRIAYFAMVAAGQSILWIGLLYPGRGIATSFPEWYEPIHRVLLAINYSHAIWLLPLGAIWLIGIGLKRIPIAHELIHRQSGSAVSRAAFLTKAAGAAAVAVNLIPAATSVAAISGMFLGSREIWLNQREVVLNNLHNDLKGLRVLQISDIHIGNLIGEKYLNFALGMIRAAKPDYVLVTGDIIDNNNAFLPVAGRFFALLNSLLPGRVYGVLGNHDYIDDGREAARGFGDAGLRILLNELVTLNRGRGKIQLAGLDYPRLGQSRGPAMQNYFARVRENRHPEMPLILMNHHPSDFEYLKNQQVDLVLSGHTHGGQINFSQDRDSLLNGARWGYKYYIDHYSENGSQLYVNRGLGHWFPLRVTCPPEITVFTLVGS